MASPKRNRWIVTLTLLLAVALGLVMIGLRTRSGDLALRIRITRAVHQGKGQPVDMNNMAAFTWDRLHILGPGSSFTEQRRAGLPWYAPLIIGLERRDDVCVLAFTLSGSYRSHTVLPRDGADCVPAVTTAPYSNATATFAVRRDGERFSLHPLTSGDSPL